MSDKKKFSRGAAVFVAEMICSMLAPFCVRCEIAGSIRRQRPTVSDIEILFVPKMAPDPLSVFDALLGGEAKMIDMGAEVINRLVKDGVLARRKNVNGSTMWGDKNKLAVHVKSGIPVDFFSTVPENWFVSLVIRTGGKKTNIALCSVAQRRGLKLHPYGDGFTNLRTGSSIPCSSEKDVFRIAGLPYKVPSERE